MALSLVCYALATAVAPGTELHYSGTVSQTVGNSTSVAKTFTLTALVAEGPDGKPELLYQLEERGGGAFPWPERFGRLPLTGAAEKRLQLLQTFDGNDYALAVRHPVFEYPEKLHPDAAWNVGQHQYSCLRQVTQRGRECWLVDASLDRARRQRIYVEQDSGLVVQMEERLFLGRGDPFELKLQLESTRQLNAAEMARQVAASHLLLELQRKLSRPEGARQAELNAEQAELTASALPALKQAAAETAWQRLVETIERDLQQQRRRLEGVSGLEKKFVGQTAPLTDLMLLSGDTLKASDLQGQVVVLHFWDYPGEKLVEPYGQVGYLDFLTHRRQKLGVKVLGIACDERLKDAGQRGAVQRSVRKLQEFMNLSYPIALDDGSLLQQFGDPRTLGAPLPLWVVVGADGKVSHYHAGHYDIKPDEGLKPLDTAVVEALKQRPQQ